MVINLYLKILTLGLFLDDLDLLGVHEIGGGCLPLVAFGVLGMQLVLNILYRKDTDGFLNTYRP